MTTVYKERDVLIEILELYKNLPSLWDPNNKSYSCKRTRRQGYEALLEKYKLIHEDADLTSLKKRIDNMRASYRRERKKIVYGMLSQGENSKTTSLWYFEHMRFLDRVMDGVPAIEINTSNFGLDSTDSNIEMEEQDADEEELEVKPEQEPNLETVFVTHDSDEDLENEIQVEGTHQLKSEAEAFGRTIGLQLNELEPEQRFIAEKLMSDVIYYARFNKLNICTRLSNV